jgi:hypothetical protein
MPAALVIGTTIWNGPAYACFPSMIINSIPDKTINYKVILEIVDTDLHKQ